jgi:hypothetical protein
MELFLYLDFTGVYIESIGLDAVIPTWTLLIPVAIVAARKWLARR